MQISRCEVGLLSQLSGLIRTFTERVEDEASVADMHRLVEEARVIVFLGFGFNKTNLDLLEAKNPTNPKRVYGTAHGISEGDRGQLRRFGRCCS